MKKIRVLIIFGGCSSEYEVSLQSAYSVITNLNRSRYQILLMGITREGKWYRYYGDEERIRLGSWQDDFDHLRTALIAPDRDCHKIMEFYMGMVEETEFDIAFPVLHGRNGEDGTIQGLFSLAGIPIVGCGVMCSALCMDKDRAHKLVSLAGVRVPKSVVLKPDILTGQASPGYHVLEEKTAALSYPLFVKPVKAGSSFGITQIFEKEQLQQAVEHAFQYDDEVIIEERIEGFEVGCAVMGNEMLTIGAVDEIELAEGFFDFAEKYTLKTSKIHMPARIDAVTAERIRETAGLIYRVLGCQGFARVDMFLTPEQEIVFNEVNTIPGFTSHSRYPSMMKGIGIDFPTLLDEVIRLGLSVHEN